MSDFRKNLQFGLDIEQRVLMLLGNEISGLQLTPISSGTNVGRGPRVYSKDFKDFDLPAHDMRGDFAGQSFDVQIKGKGYSPVYRNWQSYMHGIDLPIYDQYQTGGRLTGRKLWMIFFEVYQAKEGPGYVPSAVAQFWHSLPTAQISSPDEAFPNGGAFWPRQAFIPIINTAVKPAQLIETQRTPNAQLMLRREFLGGGPGNNDKRRACRRCGSVEMFRPRAAQTPTWMCMRCDAPGRWPDIERRAFEKPTRFEALFSAFGNAGWLYDAAES